MIASGGVVAAANYKFISSAVHGQMSSADRLITINVNGMQRRVDVMKQETLAWTLRYKLGLTGTKLGCDRAECGACTVLIDDVPHYSCSALTHTVRGRKVTTIEGLAASDGKLHPVQQAVVDEQGFQCAFCMSGFIMSAVGFLKQNPKPTAHRTRTRSFRQSVPLPGLQQDSRRPGARRRVHEEGLSMAEETGQRQRPQAEASSEARLR